MLKKLKTWWTKSTCKHDWRTFYNVHTENGSVLESVRWCPKCGKYEELEKRIREEAYDGYSYFNEYWIDKGVFKIRNMRQLQEIVEEYIDGKASGIYQIEVDPSYICDTLDIWTIGRESSCWMFIGSVDFEFELGLPCNLAGTCHWESVRFFYEQD